MNRITLTVIAIILTGCNVTTRPEPEHTPRQREIEEPIPEDDIPF